MTSRFLRRYLLAEALYGDEQLVLWERSTSGDMPHAAAVLTLLQDGEVMEQTLLSRQEQAIVRLLLDTAPTPCPYARMYAALMEMAEDEAGFLLHEASRAEVLDLLLHPVRQALVQCRVKLAPFALDIREVFGGPLNDLLACGLFRLWNRDGGGEPGPGGES